MSTERYFVSEEAEKAAKWEALEELRKARQHRDILIDAMARLGKALSDFGYVLQNPRECAFDARHNEIMVGRDRRAVARIEPTHLDWDRIPPHL